MGLYLISYDLRKVRVYDRLHALLTEWGAERLLESLWIAELRGPAEVIREIAKGTFDADDAIAVIEIRLGGQWATYACLKGGVDLLKAHRPSYP